MEKNRLINLLKKITHLTIIGIISGIIIAIYKYCIAFVLKSSNALLIESNLLIKFSMIIPVILLMTLSYFISKKDKHIKGGGLHYIENSIYRNDNSLKWYISLPSMFINSLISIFCGMPVGTEAPSVFLGGMSGFAIKDMSKEKDNDYIFSGLGAGFSAAFFNPLAGTFYTIEETVHSYNIIKIIKILYTTLIATIISYLINKEEIIHISLTNQLTLSKYYIIIIVLITNSIVSYFLIKGINSLKSFISKYKKNIIIKYRFFICFTLCLCILFLFPLLSGSGINLLNYLNNNPLWYIILIYLIIRLMLFLFINVSTITGGQLVPIFIIGALIGYIFGNIFNVEKDEINVIILISMLSMFALINKTPITSFLLTISLARISNFNIIIIPALISFIFTYITSILMHTQNITDIKRKHIQKA